MTSYDVRSVGVVERDHALELSPLHLAAPGHREGIEEADEIGNLVVGHRVARELLDLVARDDGSFDRYDARAHQLTQNVVGDADHADIVHCGMRAELIFDLARVDLISTSQDRLPTASDDPHVAFLIDDPKITGEEEAFRRERPARSPSGMRT